MGHRLLALGTVVGVALFLLGNADSQDRNRPSAFGAVKLKAGFEPDPHEVKLIAGGNIQTKKGGVTAWVGDAPDYQLYYEAGPFVLSIYAESDADTTLLINLPDGTWIADDDSGGNLNPLLKFNKPQSGRYDIWVGTIGSNNAKASLKITEMKK